MGPPANSGRFTPIYDCRSKSVHDKLFSILRDNFFDVISRTNEPALSGLAAAAGFVGLIAGVAKIAKPLEVSGEKIDSRILDQLRAFREGARFSLISLTEEGVDRDRKTYSCRANVHVATTIPVEFADALRRLPLLGVNAKGEVAGDIDVHFTVQPDPSKNNDFVVRAQRWRAWCIRRKSLSPISRSQASSSISAMAPLSCRP